MKFRVSAKLVPVGNNRLIGVDTLKLKIAVNGIVIEQAEGLIDGGGSDVVIVTAKL